MKIRQSLLAPACLSVLAALAGAPASAQDAVMLSAPTTTSSLTTLSVSGVSIKGIVSGQPESVSFSGQAQVSSRLVQDPDFGNPVLLLTVNLGSVSGVGSQTKAKYVVASEELVQRHLAPTHQVEVTFPFMKSGSTDASSARTGVASFAFSFDTNTGAVTSATGKVASPNF
jgi:hypothetical protein